MRWTTILFKLLVPQNNIYSNSLTNNILKIWLITNHHNVHQTVVDVKNYSWIFLPSNTKMSFIIISTNFKTWFFRKADFLRKINWLCSDPIVRHRQIPNVYLSLPIFYTDTEIDWYKYWLTQNVKKIIKPGHSNKNKKFSMV